MTQLINQAVHVRFQGRSEELTMSTLQLTSGATDAQIKQALTRYFDLPASTFAYHVIVRTSQTIIVRPEAIYG